jgi:hypothetical protein
VESVDAMCQLLRTAGYKADGTVQVRVASSPTGASQIGGVTKRRYKFRKGDLGASVGTDFTCLYRHAGRLCKDFQKFATTDLAGVRQAMAGEAVPA